jgi:acyl-CoA synthetase (AMP-forming)/AMP-acid ligase II
MPRDKLQEAIERFGNIFRQNYGMTEATQPIAYLGPEDHKITGTEQEIRRLGSAGRPALGVALQIVNEDGIPIEPGEIGEIQIRAPHVFKGYWKLPEETSEAFKGGWFHSGDMATVDEDGFIFIMDRKKDMIISGGFNIYPREVEDILMAHPDVTEAGVVGIPDNIWGESVKAFVVKKQGGMVTEQALIQFCKENLASYKKPKSIDFIDELPKNENGKILRKALKEPFWKGLDRRV